MARLDKAHRWRLMNKYFPAVSKQVVLFTTDTELDATLMDEARPYLARLYRLNYDAREEATQVSQIDESLLFAQEETIPVSLDLKGVD